MTFKNILCPIDFSENSSKIIELAIQLSEQEGHITLFHHSVLIVPTPGPDNPVNFEIDQELRDMAKKQLSDMASELKKKYPTRVFTIHHSFIKSMTDEINDIVEEKDIDVIVMGTHGRTGLKRLLMGSIAEDILRHAHCPVFLMKL